MSTETEQKWTPEPLPEYPEWRCDGSEVVEVYPNGHERRVMDQEEYYPRAVESGDQQRATECYNACRSMRNPAAEIAALRSQRDALLEALKEESLAVHEDVDAEGLKECKCSQCRRRRSNAALISKCERSTP